jgi:glycosyltransferase involved in cell wall biosynthesis
MAHIVFVQFSPMFGGSTISGELVIQALLARGDTVSVLVGFDGPFIHRLTQQGCAVRVVSHKNMFRTERSLSFLRNLYYDRKSKLGFLQALQELKPDLVYVNTLVSLSAAHAAYQLGLPLVWHLREIFREVGGEMSSPRWYRSLLRKQIGRWARRIIAPSETVLENVLGSTPTEHSCVIPNAVPDAFFACSMSAREAREALGLPQDVTIIGVPGTLRPVKGQPFFLRAYAQLVNERPDVHAAITGIGQEGFTQTLFQQADGLPGIHWLGAVSEMPTFYRACDLICIPSRSETFGRTAVEAFACKVPVVASAVGGLKENVRPGENGWLVPYDDDCALAAALHEGIEHPEKAAQRAALAFQDAQQHFREIDYQTAILTQIDQLLASR